MKTLINLSNYEGHIRDRFNNNYDNIKLFLDRNNLQGIELIQYGFWTEQDIPKEIIKGLHLRSYPIWYDFWKGNKEKLINKFENEENIKMLYGGMDRQCIIDHYKKELDIAEKIGVEYVVLHAAHVDLPECFSYEFEYSDEEVIDATIELVNEVFDSEKYSFKLLIENLWWPGLTFKNKDMVFKLINKIQYKNLGFMLDTGHLINTNLYIRSSDEAVAYILEVIKSLGELKEYIKGIHLNYSLSGEYVLNVIEKNKSKVDNLSFNEKFMNVYNHISKIDTHKPFENKGINKIISSLNLDFLVYELLEDSLEELENKVKIQNRYRE